MTVRWLPTVVDEIEERLAHDYQIVVTVRGGKDSGAGLFHHFGIISKSRQTYGLRTRSA
jgi:hypothetical protein